MPFANITPKEAYQKTKEGSAYLDVRTAEEFAAGHAKGAVNVPLFFKTPAGRQFNPDFLKQVQKQFSAGNPLVVGCYSGGRSAQACEILEMEGYKQICNIDGGFGGKPGQPGWKDLGLPTE